MIKKVKRAIINTLITLGECLLKEERMAIPDKISKENKMIQFEKNLKAALMFIKEVKKSEKNDDYSWVLYRMNSYSVWADFFKG